MVEGSKRILIIDDEENILKALSFRFQKDNYLVQTASDPKEGYKLAVSRKPHIILLDVMMPGISGYELFKMLKSNKSTEDIPVIMLTAKDKLRDDFLVAGASDYITKPFDYKEVKKESIVSSS